MLRDDLRNPSLAAMMYGPLLLCVLGVLVGLGLLAASLRRWLAGRARTKAGA